MPESILIRSDATTEAPLARYLNEGEVMMRVMNLEAVGHAYQQRLWLADPKLLQRRAAARCFAENVGHIDGVCEVWLTSTRVDLEVAVVLRDLDLSRELGIRGMFVDVVCDQLSPGEGELSVYAKSETIPDWIREGERLSD
jgi:hypothetical protein